jgi:cytochrome c oxidase subunit 2
MDAVPGRLHPLVLESDAPGTFIGQCTEYCGLSHGYMHQRVVALDAADYGQWLADQQTPAELPEGDTAAARGAETFTTVCSSCHLIEGVNDTEFEDLGSGRGSDGIDEADFTDEDGEVDEDAYQAELDRVASEGLVAGPAPDLTHLMSRGVFAGGVFNLWMPDENSDMPTTPLWSDIGEGGRINEADLKAWIRDAPSRKPMAPDDRRGMPTFDLPEDQVDDLYEFLITLE